MGFVAEEAIDTVLCSFCLSNEQFRVVFLFMMHHVVVDDCCCAAASSTFDPPIRSQLLDLLPLRSFCVPSRAGFLCSSLFCPSHVSE